MDDVLLTTAAEAQPEADTVVEEPAAVQDPVTEVEGSAMAATPADDTDDGAGNAAQPADEPLFAVKHNKQIHSLSRDDVTAYAQKGMKYDELQPVLDTLKYVAASEGKTLPELVEAIRKQNEDTVFSRLLDRCGDEEIARELLEVEKGKHRAAYESLLESERNEDAEADEAVTQRMATEFNELKSEFPQYTSFDAVPQAVVKEAVEKGIPLLDAQLRYEHRERVKAENARAAQANAAKMSTGAQSGAGGEQPTSAEAAFMKGLWG